jgi:hypothetical protein
LNGSIPEFLSSGRVFGLVVVVLMCEALLLVLLARRAGRTIPVQDLLISLSAGLGLAVAAVLVLQGASALAVAASLCLALLAHVVDQARRWRSLKSQSAAVQLDQVIVRTDNY